MFMQPISVPVTLRRTSRSKGLKIAAGAVFLIVGGLLTAPYLAALAVWIAAAALVRLLVAGFTFAYGAALYAGEIVLGD